MGTLLSYAIISGLMLLALYPVYKVLLGGEKQFAFNRGVLLGIYAVSMAAVPLCHLLTASPAVTREVALEAIMPAEGAVGAAGHRPVALTALIWIYMAGMAAVGGCTVRTWLRIVRLVVAGEKRGCGSHTLVLTSQEGIAPFSWMRYIVISRADYAACGTAVMDHERHHIRCRHWIDLLIAQAVVVVEWFNPAAWLLRDELMQVHEYQADMAVASAGHDIRQYQMLLIKKAVGARFPSLANSLNHSKLKKRITMMYKSKSNARGRLKALALVPAALVALAVSSRPAVQAAAETVGQTPVLAGKVSQIAASGQMAGAPRFAITDVSSRGGRTILTLEADSVSTPLGVGAELLVAGSSVRASSVSVSIENGHATADLRFPVALTGNCTLYFTVNDQTQTYVIPEGSGASPVNVFVLSPDSIGTRGAANPGAIPRVIVDGREVTMEELNTIDPSRIEAIEVRKDGGAGIVVVTLKH